MKGKRTRNMKGKRTRKIKVWRLENMKGVSVRKECMLNIKVEVLLCGQGMILNFYCLFVNKQTDT